MSRKRGLPPEDQALWRRVTESARPLWPNRKPEPPEPPALPSVSAPIAPFRLGEVASTSAPSHYVLPGIAQRLAEAPMRMDRRTFAAMLKGKLRPEGKLDLHGMTLAEARPELIRYILRASGEGRRLVLIVTGKGRERDAGGPIPVPKGILKAEVPRWLASPPLGPLVLQVSEAHRRHGGAGAYYVYLRKRG